MLSNTCDARSGVEHNWIYNGYTPLHNRYTFIKINNHPFIHRQVSIY